MKSSKLNGKKLRLINQFLGVFIFLLIPFFSLFAQFTFNQFRIVDLSDLILVNNATIEGTKLRLTLNTNNQVGACWYKLKQPVSEGFSTEFTFQITDPGGWLGGADGFAFVIQNYDNNAIGTGGGGIGYSNIPNSVAIEFDTWANGGDPNNNHISVQTKGSEKNTYESDASLAYTTNISNLSDGNVHSVKIEYIPPIIKIYLDSLDRNPVLSVTLDLAQSLQLSNGYAWVGFTAATGSGYEKHYILSWKFNPANSVGLEHSLTNTGIKDFKLNQNYPNPFNPTTTIQYELPKTSWVTLTIYTPLGQKVRTLVNKYQPTGQYQVQWDGKDGTGNPVANGVYVCKLEAKGASGESFVQMKKMILIK